MCYERGNIHVLCIQPFQPNTKTLTVGRDNDDGENLHVR
jgi:hypothetical protein